MTRRVTKDLGEETPEESKPEPVAEGSREVAAPVKFFGLDPNDDDAMFDFRVVPRPADLPDEDAEAEKDPKASSAQEPAPSSTSETTTETVSVENEESTAPVEKDNGQPKDQKSGTQTSSSQT